MDTGAENMDFRVMQALFRSGHFRQDTDYTVLRPNGTPDWLLIVSLAGAGEHRWVPGGEATPRSRPSHRVSVPAGSALLYPAGTPQWYATGKSAGVWELIWSHFPDTGRFDALLQWPLLKPAGSSAGVASTEPNTHSAPRILRLGNVLSEVHGALNELTDWHSATGSNRRQFAWNALERALLWCDTVNPLSVDGRLDDRVSEAARRIAADLRTSFSVEELAHAVGLSKSRLSHLFRKETGESVPEFVERRRMERAEDELRMGGLPVSQIARSVGFDDPLYFSRRFRRFTGKSPRQWREAARRGEL